MESEKENQYTTAEAPFNIHLQATLKLIYDQTGLSLTLCDYFTGISEHNGAKYFNVILPERLSESKDFARLQRFCRKYKSIRVEPNGLKRVAVFFDE